MVYTLLNLLSCLYRADFVNITVCAVAIYMLTFNFDIDPIHFRMLTFGTILSLIYDFMWH